MRSRLFLCAAAGLTLLATPALAQDAAADVRCLLVSNAFAATEKDTPRKQFAIESAHFFFGRIDAQMNAAQLKAQILTVGKTLTPQTMVTTMNACAQRLRAKQQMMQAIGKEVSAAAQAKK